MIFWCGFNGHFLFCLNIFYWLCYYNCPIFPPLFPSPPPFPPNQHSTPWFMSMAHTYKFFFFFSRKREKRGGEGEREGEKLQSVVAPHISHALNWGPGQQPRHVPWQGIKLVILWFTGWRSIYWATLARATLNISCQSLWPEMFLLINQLTVMGAPW